VEDIGGVGPEIRPEEIGDWWRGHLDEVVGGFLLLRDAGREPTLLDCFFAVPSPPQRTMDEVLADSVFLDVTGRTAKRLLELSSGNNEFVLPVTQEELAGMVGASRERVNKAIASFIRLGWLEQHDRRYKILMRDRMEIRAS
jgi:biotin operon repressor